jgi:hypothetical protein
MITHNLPELQPGQGKALLILNRGTAILIYVLLSLWVLSILPQAVKHLRYAMHETRWPTIEPVFLVALWAAIALAFHFALPLPEDRFATSVVVFAWPALVAEVERRGKAIFWLGLVVLCLVSLTRSSYYLVGRIAQASPDEYYGSVDAVLRQVPPGTRQIYVLSAGSLQFANPEFVRIILGVSAEIVRVVEIDWSCRDASDLVAFDHNTIDGVVIMTVTLPICANFNFYTNRLNDVVNGRLYRNDTMSYELPEAYPIKNRKVGDPMFYLGRTMTVHVRPNGPARFIIDNGHNGFTWFDTR